MIRNLVIILMVFLSKNAMANMSVHFYYNEVYIQQQLLEINTLETELKKNNYNLNAISYRYNYYKQLSTPDNDSKTAADSFFKGFTLGCIGVMDAYLEDDSKKYKRGPLWTGCCLNTLALIGLAYLLNNNYFHLIPGS